MNLLPYLLSKREIDVVRKRLHNRHLSQTESNYLSRSIRPKLRAAMMVAETKLLSRLDYRRKKYERDERVLTRKILRVVYPFLENIKAVVLFGSYIRNNHTQYRDIDILVVVKKKLWKTSYEKYQQEKVIEKELDIASDCTLVDYTELCHVFPYSPLLQTELEYQSVVYGNLKVPHKIIINKQYLYKKLLEVEPFLEIREINPRYIYNALRTCGAIELFLERKVSNNQIIKLIEDNLGKVTAESLLNATATSIQREIAIRYLKHYYKKLRGMLYEQKEAT